MSQPTFPTCQTCFFNDDSLCRRHAPRPGFEVQTKTTVKGETQYDASASFPIIGPDDWCGEHPGIQAYLARIEKESKEAAAAAAD